MFPQCFTRYDWSRSYVLPDHVTTTIPRGGSVGMLGAHNAARGLLVEICRHTGAAPVALDYRETPAPAPPRRPDATMLGVATTTRARRHPPDRVGDWTMTINGRAQVELDRVWPPSPPMQGLMVACLASRPSSVSTTHI